MRNPPNIVLDKSRNVLGVTYSFDTNQIVLHQLKYASDEECIETLLHEGDHWAATMELDDVSVAKVMERYRESIQKNRKPFLEQITFHKSDRW